MAESTEYSIPGGAVDPRHAAKRDVYLEDPIDAVAPSAYRLAQTYIEHIQSGSYDKLPDLFTEDAVIFPPLRMEPVVGRKAIEDFYLNIIGKIRPVAKAISIHGQGSECFMELASRYDVDGVQRYVMTTIDHFTLAPDGRFNRMIVFCRP